jgi:hypothetical protein
MRDTIIWNIGLVCLWWPGNCTTHLCPGGGFIDGALVAKMWRGIPQPNPKRTVSPGIDIRDMMVIHKMRGQLVRGIEI